MIWPHDLLALPPEPVVPAGYRLRHFHEADEPAHLALMHQAGFECWNHALLVTMLQKVLPDGFFVIEHLASGALTATAMATHHPQEWAPYGAELGWVAADAAHKGHGLGMAVSTAATIRLMRGGYRNIYLLTDDFRLPAIKSYLRIGYRPDWFTGGMAERWQAVLARLGQP